DAGLPVPGCGQGRCVGRAPCALDGGPRDREPGPADRLGGAEAAARHRLTQANPPQSEPEIPATETAGAFTPKITLPGRSPVRYRAREHPETPRVSAPRPENHRHTRTDWLKA